MADDLDALPPRSALTAVHPTPEQVLSLAPDRHAAGAAASAADPTSWSAAGHDETGVWGKYLSTTAEPYDVAVDLRGPAFRCNCPSRKLPCKHALGLLLLHAHRRVSPANRLPFADRWLRHRDAEALMPPDSDAGERTPIDSPDPTEVVSDDPVASGTAPPRAHDPAREQRRLHRAERMRAGLVDLDRWLADQMRRGLAAPELSDPATWDRAAARLVDAQCGGLANRMRRVAARVGEHSGWHEDVLEELALLHALACGAQRTSALPDDLADAVHLATGLTVAKDDVLAGVPSTAGWLVAGESRTREDRITVQRTWLCALDGGRPSTWAMVLSFGTFGNDVASEHPVGHVVDADVHWYPGGIALRALVGRQHSTPQPAASAPMGTSVLDGVAAAGTASAREPWIERFPMLVSATPVPTGTGRWALSDHTGSLPIVPGFWRTAEIVCASGGAPVTIMGEWSVDGVLPLTLWSDGAAVML